MTGFEAHARLHRLCFPIRALWSCVRHTFSTSATLTAEPSGPTGSPDLTPPSPLQAATRNASTPDQPSASTSLALPPALAIEQNPLTTHTGCAV